MVLDHARARARVDIGIGAALTVQSFFPLSLSLPSLLLSYRSLCIVAPTVTRNIRANESVAAPRVNRRFRSGIFVESARERDGERERGREGRIAPRAPARRATRGARDVRHAPVLLLACPGVTGSGQLAGGLRTISICLSRNHGDRENRNFPRRGHLWPPALSALVPLPFSSPSAISLLLPPPRTVRFLSACLSLAIYPARVRCSLAIVAASLRFRIDSSPTRCVCVCMCGLRPRRLQRTLTARHQIDTRRLSS